MASGHVNRVKRPNTWLHRPMLQNVKKALANSEPSTHDPLLPFPRTMAIASPVLLRQALTGRVVAPRTGLRCYRLRAMPPGLTATHVWTDRCRLERKSRSALL